MSGTSDKLQRPAILIVEDRSLMRVVLHDLIQNAFPGCAVLEAADGAEAVRLSMDHQPRLVLMDIGLPDANGIELTARIKATLPATEVIVVSYCSGRIYVERALAAGARAYVTKDQLLRDLVPAVAEVLSVAPAGRAAPQGFAA